LQNIEDSNNFTGLAAVEPHSNVYAILYGLNKNKICFICWDILGTIIWVALKPKNKIQAPPTVLKIAVNLAKWFASYFMLIQLFIVKSYFIMSNLQEWPL
jgi:hypothetical protein